jgi:hypothetical protein
MLSIFQQLPLVVSYYTLNTPYEKEVEGLRSSCEQFGIEAHIEGISNLGSWEKNCAFKPFFIREKMREFQRPLFWLDADAVFLQQPKFEMFLTYDFSVLKFPDTVSMIHRVRASTVFINSTVEGLGILDEWCGATEKITLEMGSEPPFLDQISLYWVLMQNQIASIGQMPLSYCKVFDYDSELIDQKNVVIEQNQASRRLKSFYQLAKESP